jgi:pyruvate/2-oxoglutarate dehydrogenase complex dihydrolipoamide acyltransferase (E2) component
VLDHSAYQAALIGASNHYEDSEKALEKSKEAAAVLADDRIFALKDFNYGVSVEGKSVNVTYNCVVNMPFQPWLRQYVSGFSDEYMSYETTKSAKRLRPARIIRTCRTINNIGNKMKE